MNLKTFCKADIVLLDWCFWMLTVCFHLSFYMLYYYHTVRFCNKIFVRFRRIISWPPHCGGPAIVMVCFVRLSVWLWHANISETKRIGNRASRFRICHQIRDRKYGSAILGVSGLALRPFRQKWAGWASEWISGNDYQSAPHWAPWRASYRQVLYRTLPCFVCFRVWKKGSLRFRNMSSLRHRRVKENANRPSSSTGCNRAGKPRFLEV